MAPFYRGYVANFQLHSDDIAGIQAHYGMVKDKCTFFKNLLILSLLNEDN